MAMKTKTDSAVVSGSPPPLPTPPHAPHHEFQRSAASHAGASSRFAISRITVLVGSSVILGVVVLLMLVIFSRNSPTASSSAGEAQGDSPAEISPALLQHNRALASAGGQTKQDDAGQIIVNSRTNRTEAEDPWKTLQTGEGSLEFTNASGRLALRYKWTKSDPLKDGWNHFTRPRAWVYQSPQRLIYISADEGKVKIASNRQPENGTLSGSVHIALFESQAQDGAYQIDPTRAAPVATFDTDSIDFDATLFTAHTDASVTLATNSLFILGDSMTLAYSEKTGRIEEFSLAHRHLMVYRPVSGAPLQTHASANRTLAQFVSRIQPFDHTPGLLVSKSVSLRRNTQPAGTAALGASAADPWGQSVCYDLKLPGEVIIRQGATQGSDGMVITGRDLESKFVMQKVQKSGEPVADRSTQSPTDVETSPSLSPDGLRAQFAASFVPAGSPDVQPASFSKPSLINFKPGSGVLADDIVITGDGALDLIPLDSRPSELADPADVFATLAGNPVKITKADAFANGSKIEYSRAQALARLYPLASGTLEAGVEGSALISSSSPFEWYMDRRVGMIRGAGTLKGLSPQPSPARSSNSASSPPVPPRAFTGLPEGFNLNWQTNFSVDFTQAARSSAAPSDPAAGNVIAPDPRTSGLGELQSTTFTGGVRLDSPDGIGLSTDQLTVTFKPRDHAPSLPTSQPPVQPTQQQIDSIDARGNTKFTSSEGFMSGDAIHIAFADVDAHGSSFPSQVQIQGSAAVSDGTSTIAAQQIHADIVPRTAVTEQIIKPGSLFTGSSSVAISHLLAQNTVRISSSVQEFHAAGDRLEADAATDRAVLTGSSVVLGDASMNVICRTVEILQLSQPHHLIHIPGSGTLTYLQASGPVDESSSSAATPDAPAPNPPQMPAAAQPPALRENTRRLTDNNINNNNNNNDEHSTAGSGNTVNLDEYQIMTVQWADNLLYDEEMNLIKFSGQVVASASPTPAEFDRMTGSQMTIELSDPRPSQHQDSPTGASAAIPVRPDEFGASRSLRKVTMIGSGPGAPARINAVRYTDASRTVRELLMALDAPTIEFTEATQLFNAIGAGNLLIADHADANAPSSDNNAAPKALPPSPLPQQASPPRQPVQFTGRGDTDFSWKKEMTVDGLNGAMLMTGGVVMRHRPPGEPVIHLNCQTLSASVTEDGSRPLTDSQAGAGRFDAVRLSGSHGLVLSDALATGNVFIKRLDRSIWADSLHFDRASQLATLQSAGDSSVIVQSDNSPGATSARKVIWDLYKDSIIVEGAGIDAPISRPLDH